MCFILNEWPPQAHVSGGAVWEVVGHLGTRVLLMDVCPLQKVLRFYKLAPFLVCSLLWDCWCYVRSGPHAPGCYHFPIVTDAGTVSQNKPLSPLNCFCWCLNTVTKIELTQYACARIESKHIFIYIKECTRIHVCGGQRTNWVRYCSPFCCFGLCVCDFIYQ